MPVVGPCCRPPATGAVPPACPPASGCARPVPGRENANSMPACSSAVKTCAGCKARRQRIKQRKTVSGEQGQQQEQQSHPSSLRLPQQEQWQRLPQPEQEQWQRLQQLQQLLLQQPQAQASPTPSPVSASPTAAAPHQPAAPAPSCGPEASRPTLTSCSSCRALAQHLGLQFLPSFEHLGAEGNPSVNQITLERVASVHLALERAASAKMAAQAAIAAAAAAAAVPARLPSCQSPYPYPPHHHHQPHPQPQPLEHAGSAEQPSLDCAASASLQASLESNTSATLPAALLMATGSFGAGSRAAAAAAAGAVAAAPSAQPPIASPWAMLQQPGAIHPMQAMLASLMAGPLGPHAAAAAAAAAYQPPSPTEVTHQLPYPHQSAPYVTAPEHSPTHHPSAIHHPYPQRAVASPHHFTQQPTAATPSAGRR